MRINLPPRFREINKPVIFFDGVCNFCNFWVQWIIGRDPGGLFYFASLQSNAGQELLRALQHLPLELDTMILLDKDEVYTQSSAALHVAQKLGGVWNVGFVFMIVPEAVRNFIYRMIARNRYRWFGKKDSCMVPSKEIMSRFLN